MKLTPEFFAKLLADKTGNPNVQVVSSIDPSVQAILPKRLQNNCADLEGPLEPVFYAKSQESLLISDKPPMLGGIVKSIPTIQFCSQEKIQWSEAPLLHRKRRENLFHNVARVNLEVHALQTWFQGANHFVIANMSANQNENFRSIGNGAFYFSKDKTPIPAGVCFANYTGIIISQGDGKFYANGFLAGKQINEMNTFCQFYGNALYDAQSVRNTTTYFQHAPLEEELEGIKMPQNLKKLVLTANLVPNLGVNSPIPTISFISRREIQHGEPLCFPYGNYWKDMATNKQGDGSYALFDLDGDIIGTVNLKNQFTPNPKYNPEGKKPAPRCNAMANDKVCDLLASNTKINKDCAAIFQANIRFIINLYLNRKNTEDRDFYEKNDLLILKRIRTICLQDVPQKVSEELEPFLKKLEISHPHLNSVRLELFIQLKFYQHHHRLLDPKSSTASVATAPLPQNPTIGLLDEPTIKVLYAELKLKTIATGWKMDTHQNFWIEGDEAQLRQIRAHLSEQSVNSIFQKTADGKQFRLKLPASNLLNKHLLPMKTVETHNTIHISDHLKNK